MAYVFIDENGNYTDPPPGFDFQTGAGGGMKLRTSLGEVGVTHERVVTKTQPNVVRMFRFTLGTQSTMIATWKDTPPFTEDGVRELIRDAGGADADKPTGRLADALREVAGLVPVISDDDAGDSNEYVRGDIIPDTTGAERP